METKVCGTCGDDKPVAGNFTVADGYIGDNCNACLDAMRERVKAEKKAAKEKNAAAKRVKVAAETGAPVDSKVCNDCGIRRPLKSFNGGRAKCTPCRNARAKELAKSAVEANPGDYRMCSGCETRHSIADFDGDNKTCRKKLASAAKSDARPERKEYHRLLNAERKYYSKCRAKQIEMMPVEYREHLAKRQREYYAAHSEVILKQQAIRPATQLSSSKKGARERGITWELTDNEAIELIKSPCFYSGLHVPDEHTTGIDRLDSKQGYTSDNVVPCNGIVNMMKNTMSVTEFVDVCGLAASGEATLGTETMRSRYNSCVKRNMHAPLTFEELCAAITENFNSEE